MSASGLVECSPGWPSGCSAFALSAVPCWPRHDLVGLAFTVAGVVGSVLATLSRRGAATFVAAAAIGHLALVGRPTTVATLLTALLLAAFLAAAETAETDSWRVGWRAAAVDHIGFAVPALAGAAAILLIGEVGVSGGVISTGVALLGVVATGVVIVSVSRLNREH